MPYWVALLGQFDAPDIVSIFVSLVALVLAISALRLSKKQVVLAEEQTTLSRKQTDVMEEQLARKANLTVEIHQRRNGMNVDEDEYFLDFTVQIRNSGDKSANHLYWHLFIEPTSELRMRFTPDRDSEIVTSKLAVTGETAAIITEKAGFYERPIYPEQAIVCGRIHLLRKKAEHPLGHLRIHWYVESDAGKFPASGFGTTTSDFASGTLTVAVD